MHDDGTAPDERGSWVPDIVTVVPCFNEAARIEPEAFSKLLAVDEMGLIFVDDGSTDDTRSVLEKIRVTAPERITVLALHHNVGKANAVAAGLRAATAAGAEWVGYLDADLAVPTDEWIRVIGHRTDHVDGILASRVRLLGRAIDRKTYRHLIGRVFATYASILLRLPVYDTQCGGKLFRTTTALSAALDEPFVTRWLFDVELLARLCYPPEGSRSNPSERLLEVPLRRWQDVSGSSLTVASGPSVLRQVVSLTREVRRLRKTASK